MDKIYTNVRLTPRSLSDPWIWEMKMFDNGRLVLHVFHKTDSVNELERRAAESRGFVYRETA